MFFRHEHHNGPEMHDHQNGSSSRGRGSSRGSSRGRATARAGARALNDARRVVKGLGEFFFWFLRFFIHTNSFLLCIGCIIWFTTWWKAVATKKGPNDARRVVWALGEFLFFFCLFFLDPRVATYHHNKKRGPRRIQGPNERREGCRGSRRVLGPLVSFFLLYFTFFSLLITM